MHLIQLPPCPTKMVIQPGMRHGPSPGIPCLLPTCAVESSQMIIDIYISEAMLLFCQALTLKTVVLVLHRLYPSRHSFTLQLEQNALTSLHSFGPGHGNICSCLVLLDLLLRQWPPYHH